MRSLIRRRGLAVVLAAAAVAGYAGAAAVTALAEPAVAVAGDHGPDDGLSRYVVTADAGVSTEDLVVALDVAGDVVDVQALSDGRALVATEGLAPHHLEALPGVADAEYSPPVPVLGDVTDPYWSSYGWNLENTGTNAYNQAITADVDVDATTGWGGGTGRGMIVAVTDTGFDSDHPDLVGSLWTNPAEDCGSVDRDGNGKAGDCHGWNFVTDSADIDNGAGGTHGTSVAAVVGARAGNGEGTAGVAPDVQIMPLVIGTGDGVDAFLGAEAIRYAADHGAAAVNASWGGQFTGSALTAVRDAIDYAESKGVVVVAASGNDAGNRDTAPLYPASYTNSNLITVGSHTASDTVTPSSAYGATSVDLFAPGNLVFTAWNDGGYRLVGGTSIAAPHVAAAVALYRARMPDATADEIKAALLDDVEPVPAYAGKSVTGGRLSLTGLAEAPSDRVDYRFTSMTAPAGVVTPRVAATGSAGSGDYAVTLGLGMEYQGEVWAVADAELTVGGTTVTTDDSGTARFALGTAAGPGALALSPSVELGDGRYVLTVQLEKDGAPLGASVAAPLLVGSAVTTPPSTPGTPDTGGSGPGSGGTPPGGGGSTPGTPGTPGSPSTPGTGGTSPGTGDTPPGGDPGDPDTPPGGGGSTPGTPRTPNSPSTPGTGGTSPGTGDTPPGGGPGDPGTPGTPGTGGTTPGTGGTTPGTGNGGGDDGGEVTFPEVGPFGITSLSPARVGTAGGETVTIRGTALPDGARVRVGDSATAVVLRVSADQLQFRAPARAAGSYDVHVFAPDGRQSVLGSALTYVAAGTGDTVPGGSTPDGPGTEPGGTPPGGSTPGGSTPGGTTPGGSGTGGTVRPDVVTGPAGQRLVRNARFDGLRGIWSTDCSVSCTGVVI
ncbi:S8 family serine peptidase [Geodermatophilus sp. SYSU D00742]